jgi:hypothetical protein
MADPVDLVGLALLEQRVQVLDDRRARTAKVFRCRAAVTISSSTNQCR